ncbi:MAG: L,D-transpeptidase [Gammaproteobacteria bacterium]|jgi:L,D-transpeptidase YbiS|nr:L,D-transpeptidase [Gammaproteobacteria bacterium]MBT7308534.1 L,D-transpeptidase [Gammaproteobacteria bacterium]
MEIRISLKRQQLTLYREGKEPLTYSVSTALRGAGEQWNSGCTPRGRHHVRIKIGAGCPLNSVFVGRRYSGEIYSEPLARQYPDRDWILSRILWLSGDESGLNRGGNIDTLRRMIYIHGTPDCEPMGVPRSHGCVRMRSGDVMDLFERVAVGTTVWIEE